MWLQAPDEQKVQVHLVTAADARRLLACHFRRCTDERLAVAYLSGQGRLLGTRLSAGRNSEVALEVRPILSEGLRRGAAAFLVAHNHPSGDTRPSQADIQATRRLAEGARLVGLTLVDHLIFAGDDCRSLRASGLL